ncbi:hypothetical protein MCOR01_006401 [Pyricularia oryzae]|nr:hypothetical protein MCOR01_006401 [Pyricularia oryzae]
MSNIAAYTPLESFLLFKALYARGVSAAVFDDISADLINYEFIKDDATYDVTRLSPASLQELFLHLLRDELKLNVDTSDKVSDGSLSPNKRRKLHAPTPRNLQEAAEHLPKVPNVLQRLYKEWRAHRITSILEDEQRFEQISAEIAKAEKEAAPTTKNGAGDAAPQSQPAVPSPTPRTTPAPQVRKDTGQVPNGVPQASALPLSNPKQTLHQLESVTKSRTPTPVPAPSSAVADSEPATPLSRQPSPAAPPKFTPTQAQSPRPGPVTLPSAVPTRLATSTPPTIPGHQVSTPPRVPSPAAALVSTTAATAQPPAVHTSQPSLHVTPVTAHNAKPQPPRPSPAANSQPIAPQPVPAQNHVSLQNNPRAGVAPPSQFGQAALTAGRGHNPPPRPPNGAAASPVLQHPQAVSAPPSRPIVAQQQPGVLQRPEAIGKPKVSQPPPRQATPNPTPGTPLKWEPPYQPQQPSTPLQRPPIQHQHMQPANPVQQQVWTPQALVQAQAQAQAQAKIQSQHQPQVQPQHQPQVQPHAQAQAQAKIQSQHQPQVQPQHQPQVQPHAQAQAQAQAQAKIQSQHQPQIQSQHQPQYIQPQGQAYPQYSGQPQHQQQPQHQGQAFAHQPSQGQIQAQGQARTRPGHGQPSPVPPTPYQATPSSANSTKGQQPARAAPQPGSAVQQQKGMLVPPQHVPLAQPHTPASDTRKTIHKETASQIVQRKPGQATMPLSSQPKVPTAAPQAMAPAQPGGPQGLGRRQPPTSNSPVPSYVAPQPFTSQGKQTPGRSPNIQQQPQQLKPQQPHPTQNIPIQQAPSHPTASIQQAAVSNHRPQLVPRPSVPAGPRPSISAASASSFATPQPGVYPSPQPKNQQPSASVSNETLNYLRSTPKTTPTPGFKPTPTLPQTPSVSNDLGYFAPRGSATRWKSAVSTPSTPKPEEATKMSLPPMEPLSPVQASATLPQNQKLSPVVSTSKPTAPAAESPPSKTQAKNSPVPKLDVSTPKARGRVPRGKMQEAPKSPPASAHETPRLEPQDKMQVDAAEPVPARVPEPLPEPVQVPVSEPEPEPEPEAESAIIKKEAETPRMLEETGDTTADESVPSKRQPDTPSSQPTRRVKRKRAESPSDDRADTAVPTPTAKSSDTLPAGAGTSNNSAPVQASKSLQTMTRNHVRWTRDFPKISASALEQITSHRHANMFAHPIRERDAPGYHNIVRGPMDLKSIRAAITHGNRAAKQAVANLPNGDPGTSMVWLRKSEDLVPPRGIINITHLDQALTQMFSNAIMYNQDPNRGPGPSFLEELEEPTDDGADASTTAASGGGAASSVLGYKVDENAVVNDTIAMHLEVEKLLENIREAEKQRAAPPPPPVDDEDDKGHYDTNGDTKADHADVETDRAEREGTDATEGETPSGAIASNTGTTKRRRIARG